MSDRMSDGMSDGMSGGDSARRICDALAAQADIGTHPFVGGPNGWCLHRLGDGVICGGRSTSDVHEIGPKAPPLRTDDAAQLSAIRLTFTPSTGRVNLACVVHGWWGHDQVEPTFAAVWGACAEHVCVEHRAG